jgi:hypothetical protein
MKARNPKSEIRAKPCPRVLIAALAEAKLVTYFWLRQSNSTCVNGAANSLRATLQGLPAHIRIGLLRADSGLGCTSTSKWIVAMRAVDAVPRRALGRYGPLTRRVR